MTSLTALTSERLSELTGQSVDTGCLVIAQPDFSKVYNVKDVMSKETDET